jgi:hypothetical protein
VHAGLIGWLCWIGAAPARGVFLVFGPPLVLVYVLALFSVARLRRGLGRLGWRLLRVIGMNAIAAAFALDLLGAPMFDSAVHAAEYAPFAALSVLGFALQAAWLLPPSWRPRRPGERDQFQGDSAAQSVASSPVQPRGKATTVM